MIKREVINRFSITSTFSDVNTLLAAVDDV